MVAEGSGRDFGRGQQPKVSLTPHRAKRYAGRGHRQYVDVSPGPQRTLHGSYSPSLMKASITTPDPVKDPISG